MVSRAVWFGAVGKVFSTRVTWMRFSHIKEIDTMFESNSHAFCSSSCKPKRSVNILCATLSKHAKKKNCTGVDLASYDFCKKGQISGISGWRSSVSYIPFVSLLTKSDPRSQPNYADLNHEEWEVSIDRKCRYWECKVDQGSGLWGRRLTLSPELPRYLYSIKMVWQ